MIHDVTIPFRFDTSPIEQQIANIGEQEAERVVSSTVKMAIADALPKKYRSYGYSTDDSEIDWKRFIGERLDGWIDGHKQEIIDEAAMLLAMRASRRVAWREVLDEYRKEADGIPDE